MQRGLKRRAAELSSAQSQDISKGSGRRVECLLEIKESGSLYGERTNRK